MEPTTAAIALLSGALFASLLGNLRQALRKGKAHPAGAVDVEFKFFGHPEHILPQLERDLALFAKDDRLEVRFSVIPAKGWPKTARIFAEGPITGTPKDVLQGICAAMMDYDTECFGWTRG